MVTSTIIICNRLGLHARAAAKFANAANRFSSNVRVRCRDKTIDGKSIMALMLLAASKDTEIEITVQGEDEVLALETLVELVTNKFGEEL